MPYGTPLTQSQRTARHQSIYGDEPPATRQLQCRTTNVGITDENKTLLTIVGGAAAIYVFVEFVLPNIWEEWK